MSFFVYKGNYTWYECNMHFTALFSSAVRLRKFRILVSGWFVQDILITVSQ